MATEKTCFIIMPITTPDNMRDKYRDGEEHFKHVLQCLFIPSIEKAGFKAIPPIAKGSDLIHAGIVNNLETSDLVLCDMSCLNANVFFEFGIRTALNKAVCIVKDEFPINVPFDTGILNHQEYQSSLDSWHLKTGIDNLVEHIKASDERSKGINNLWKYFGLKNEAEPYKGESKMDNRLAMLGFQIDSLNKKIDSITMRDLGALSALTLVNKEIIQKDINHIDIDGRIKKEYKPILRNFLEPEMKILDIARDDQDNMVVIATGNVSNEYLSEKEKLISEKLGRNVGIVKVSPAKMFNKFEKVP
jgi:hypothetical protein